MIFKDLNGTIIRIPNTNLHISIYEKYNSALVWGPGIDCNFSISIPVAKRLLDVLKEDTGEGCLLED